MIYFNGSPVRQMGEDWAVLADGSRLSGIHDMSLFTDDCGGEAIFEQRMALIREKRNRLLAESDWTQIIDNDLSDEAVWQWRTYRQALRDLPQGITTHHLEAIAWPAPPPAELR